MTPTPRIVTDYIYRNQITADEARARIRQEMLDYFAKSPVSKTIYQVIAGYLKGTISESVAAVRWASRDR